MTGPRRGALWLTLNSVSGKHEQGVHLRSVELKDHVRFVTVANVQLIATSSIVPVSTVSPSSAALP
jgi:hypothetical protein